MSLPPLSLAFVGDPVAAGAYGNASEALRAGERSLRFVQAARLRREVGSMAKSEDANEQRFSVRDLGDAHG